MHARSFHLILLVLFFFLSKETHEQISGMATSEAASSVLAQANEDRYKLVIAPSKMIVQPYAHWSSALAERSRELLALTNSITASGYRLKTLLSPIAILAKDPGGYQYRFLSNPTEPEIRTIMDEGFHLFSRYDNGQQCDSYYIGDERGQTCDYSVIYVYEKPLNSNRKAERYVVERPDGLVPHPANIMAAEINKKVAEGFCPVSVISKFEVVLEKISPCEVGKYHSEFALVREGSDIENKVNVLAKKGYRVLLADDGIALLYRNDKTKGIPVAYRWADSEKKDFAAILAKLELAGARYCTVVSAGSGKRKFLIFESPAQPPARPSEFKTITIDQLAKIDPADGMPYLDLTDESKRNVAEINKLAAQGFIVRDLFGYKKTQVLLERTQ
ncbi:MAG: hypothetical protein ABI878_15265 [Acidobacteriota bacterium]